MVDEIVGIWDLTQLAVKGAGINRPMPPALLTEKQGLTAPRLWKGMEVIERDTRVNKRVHLFSPDGHQVEGALVVDDERSPELKTIYNEVLGRMVSRAKEKRFIDKNLAFGAISTVVNEVFPRWNGVMEAERELSNSFSGKLMDIGENIRAQLGVCEHITLVAAYIMERLIDEGYLRGRVSVDRNYIPERKVSHAWVRYTSKDGKVFILDIAKGVSGSMAEAMAKNKWDYRRPGEKVPTLALPKWW